MYYTIAALEKEYKNKKIYKSNFMNTKFNELLEHFYQATTESEKNTIYGEMEEYAYFFRRDYSCYDVDMYIALYKCAKTDEQREYALQNIQDVIDEDAFQYHDELHRESQAICFY